jgi:MFS family permease
MRLPFFYGWVVVAVVFVTMGVGVNARTAFSLLFPPVLAEFGWERGVTAGAFSFGFLISAALSPMLGRLMDRRGPRVVMEMGVFLMGAGLLLATLVRQPWHLYLTLGVLVGGGSVCLGFTGQGLFLPNWFVRRRGLAMSLAFSGVGVGSIILLPWMQVLIGRAGWRTACWAMAILVLALLAPLNLLLRRRPEDLGLAPDGDPASRQTAAAQAANVVDAAWAAVDWTLARAMRTSRFWWIAAGYFGGLFSWYAVQVHQTKYLIEIGFSPTYAAWALGFVSLVAIPGQIALDGGQPRLRHLLLRADSHGACADPRAGLAHGDLAGRARLRAHVSGERHSRRDLPGTALRQHLRHAHALGHRGWRGGAVGRRLPARCHRQLPAPVLDGHRLQPPLRRRHLAGRSAQGARGGGAGASDQGTPSAQRVRRRCPERP